VVAGAGLELRGELGPFPSAVNVERLSGLVGSRIGTFMEGRPRLSRPFLLQRKTVFLKRLLDDPERFRAYAVQRG
jgi:hypothetical protein